MSHLCLQYMFYTYSYEIERKTLRPFLPVFSHFLVALHKCVVICTYAWLPAARLWYWCLVSWDLWNEGVVGWDGSLLQLASYPGIKPHHLTRSAWTHVWLVQWSSHSHHTQPAPASPISPCFLFPAHFSLFPLFPLSLHTYTNTNYSLTYIRLFVLVSPFLFCATFPS